MFPLLDYLVPADYQCSNTTSYFWALAEDSSYAIATNRMEEEKFCYENSGLPFDRTITDECLKDLMERLPRSMQVRMANFKHKNQTVYPVLCSRKLATG